MKIEDRIAKLIVDEVAIESVVDALIIVPLCTIVWAIIFLL